MEFTIARDAIAVIVHPTTREPPYLSSRFPAYYTGKDQQLERAGRRGTARLCGCRARPIPARMSIFWKR